jgi:long-chain acyl-CoA synthetase
VKPPEALLVSLTLVRIFLDAVDADRPAMFMRRGAAGWESIPGRRAFEEVESLMLALRDLGVERGDRIAILSETRYEWSLCDLAILGLGAITVPIYPSLTAEQCAYVLGNAGCRAAIASSVTQAGKLRRAGAECPGLSDLVLVDPDGPAGAGATEAANGSGTPREHRLDALLARGAALRAADPGAYRESAASVQADDLATIVYTSGTTGDPKGAMLTHGNIASNVTACLEIVDLGPTDRSLSFLPLCHIFERMAGLYAMMRAGATIAYARGFDTVGDDAQEVHPTILNAVPRFYEKVRERVLATAETFSALRRPIFEWGMEALHERSRARLRRHGHINPWQAFQARLADRIVAARIRERVGGRLRLCVSGGAPLPGHVIEFFFAIGVPIIEGYGLTETSPVICLNRPGHERPGSVGPPIPGVDVRIGDDGEILTKSPCVMRGYYGNEEATRAAIRDGWFHTGDVGHFDDEGCLRITDRLKDLLVTAGGTKVAPQPLEARLKQSPLIAEAVLLGDRRPYIVALIVPDFEALGAEAARRGWNGTSRVDLLGREEVGALFGGEVDRLNAGLASFERIKGFALLPAELTQENGEITPTLKVKRRVIMERYARVIEGLYARGR